MENIIKKAFGQSDEIKKQEKISFEEVMFDKLRLWRVSAEPGWQWSKHSKPVIGGESCQRQHYVYVLSGLLKTRMDDGSEAEFGPGEAGIIRPGHDGWNAGDEPAVWLDFSQVTD
jgi:quercetin dioxygenase-like cupin family protein